MHQTGLLPGAGRQRHRHSTHLQYRSSSWKSRLLKNLIKLSHRRQLRVVPEFANLSHDELPRVCSGAKISLTYSETNNILPTVYAKQTITL